MLQHDRMSVARNRGDLRVVGLLGPVSLKFEDIAIEVNARPHIGDGQDGDRIFDNDSWFLAHLGIRLPLEKTISNALMIAFEDTSAGSALSSPKIRFDLVCDRCLNIEIAQFGFDEYSSATVNASEFAKVRYRSRLDRFAGGGFSKFLRFKRS